MRTSPQIMISIVIPVFNEEKNLPDALKSIFGQEIQVPFEVIIVDNNSTDNSVEEAKKFDCKIIREEKQGITWARRKGLAVAQGSIIVQFDADSTANSRWLDNLMKPFFTEKNVVFTHGAVTVKNKTFKTNIYFTLINFLKRILSKTTLMSSGYNFAYLKQIGEEIMNNNAYLELQYYEDTFFSFEIGRHKGFKVFVPGAVVETSARRIESESLRLRIVHWLWAMSHYLIYNKFPAWAYTKKYLNYR